MLHRAKTLAGYKLDSLDGEIGRAEEFYFDDKHWVVRYLVADTIAGVTGPTRQRHERTFANGCFYRKGSLS
jgi:hypothetical protein